MSRQLPTLPPRKVIQALERGGFFVDHVTGSHYRMKHRHDPTRSTVVCQRRRKIGPAWRRKSGPVTRLEAAASGRRRQLWLALAG